MNQAQSAAMQLLKPEERLSLSLQLGNDKSTWEAGEMMNKSHYKYLEIFERAKKFMKAFTEYYDFYPNFFPPDIYLTPQFRTYITSTILKRQNISTAIAYVNDPAFFNKKQREELITKEMQRLKASKGISEQNFYSIVMDFDRYNNFRILPRDIQEPSAFKRRNKTRYKKHLKNAVTLPAYTIMRLEQLYGKKALRNIKTPGYVPIVISREDEVSKLMLINANEETIAQLSKISLYVFADKDKATQFLNLVLDYTNITTPNPRLGLKFWPEFRNLIKLALNYEQINNIAPSRRGIETAMLDMDILYKKKAQK